MVLTFCCPISHLLTSQLFQGLWECHVHAEMSCGCWKSWTWGARTMATVGRDQMVSVARRTRIQDPAPGAPSWDREPRSNLHQGSQSPAGHQNLKRSQPLLLGSNLASCEDTLLG